MLSILCEKFPRASNTNIDKITPIITIGARVVECKNVARIPTTIMPIATNAVK